MLESLLQKDDYFARCTISPPETSRAENPARRPPVSLAASGRAKAEALYEAGAPVPDMVAELGRSRGAILNRAAEKRWHRPPSTKWKRSEVTWEVQDFKLSQAEPCAT